MSDMDEEVDLEGALHILGKKHANAKTESALRTYAASLTEVPGFNRYTINSHLEAYARALKLEAEVECAKNAPPPPPPKPPAKKQSTRPRRGQKSNDEGAPGAVASETKLA